MTVYNWLLDHEPACQKKKKSENVHIQFKDGDYDINIYTVT